MNHRPSDQQEHDADLLAWVILVGLAIAVLAFGVGAGMLLSLLLD
jgi:hypothetical protein